MNSHTAQSSKKDVLKHQEYIKQQHQLREFGSMKNNSHSKVLSADSMIEDLLSKKETFQKRNPESLQNQESTLPPWFSRSPPPLFERVWQGVQAAGGLANTPLLSSVLLTSGLPTDTLGYIWSLANRTVPGALTQSEVYLVLTLVGLAQAGYVVNNLSALHQVPQAPVPTLDLTLLPTRQSQIYPNTLNVTNLPDPLSFNWMSPDAVGRSCSGKIDVSYVSNGHMVNSLSDQTKTSLNMKTPADRNIIESFSSVNNIVSKNLKPDFGLVTTDDSNVKHYHNTHGFSFPKLNDSPSHVINDNTNLSDDEFTEFQSADFSTISEYKNVENNVNSVSDKDEFTCFQNAPPNYNGDNLSVFVIGGKHIPSVVTDKPSIIFKTGHETKEDSCRSLNVYDDITSKHHPNTEEKEDTIKRKYNAFQEMDDYKYSVFHNPLSDECDKQSAVSNIPVENDKLETKSIFQHSLFYDPEPLLDTFKSDIPISTLDLPTLHPTQPINDVIEPDENDDEYSNFQNFPVTFLESSNDVSSKNIDKYDVFRTSVFENSSQEHLGQSRTVNNTENHFHVQSFDLSGNGYQNGDCYNAFSDNPETKSVDSIHFGDIPESVILPTDNGSNIDGLFSSLAISDKKNEAENTFPELDPAEDKYKALRVLEPSNVDVDDFGEFFGAEFPNSENNSRNPRDPTSIQIRCLEACLKLLKDAEGKMSQCSTPDVVSEVLSDARANTYLDCLLEVHCVSQRIISELNCDLCVSVIAELDETWDKLAPYFKHSEHTNMVESVGTVCGVCRSNTGPSPVTFGSQSFHTPCANLYLHCVEPVLPNIEAALVQ